jgi:hypothetical protein
MKTTNTKMHGKETILDLSEYTLQELKDLYDKVGDAIYSWTDGELYICEIARYGSNYTEKHNNVEMVRESCYTYNGDNGIMDVYTTNKNIFDSIESHNFYGDVYLIENEDTYKKYKDWAKNYHFYLNVAKDWSAVQKWDSEASDNSSYMWNKQRRPYEPSICMDEVLENIKMLEEKEKDIIVPIKMCHTTEIE